MKEYHALSTQGSYWQSATGAAAEISAEKVENCLKYHLK